MHDSMRRWRSRIQYSVTALINESTLQPHEIDQELPSPLRRPIANFLCQLVPSREKQSQPKGYFGATPKTTRETRTLTQAMPGHVTLFSAV
jgi:hypothetical protein